MDNSIWNRVKEYINEHEYHIRPIDIKNEIKGEFGTRSNSITSYVNYIHKAKFIERRNRGIYVRVRNIPTDLTLEKIIKFVYNGETRKECEDNVDRYWKLYDLKNKLKK